MTPEEMRQRTKMFALQAISYCRCLPNDEISRIVARQFIRCATSVGANYRAASLAKSPADMLSKLKTVEEEADECCYWLELLAESGAAPQEATNPLADEAREIFKIIVASIKTIRLNQQMKSEDRQ